MRPRTALTLAGAAALLVAAGVAVRPAWTDQSSEFTAQYTQTAVWDGGLIGSFTVSNPSNRLASGWTLSFSLPDDTRGQEGPRPRPASRQQVGATGRQRGQTGGLRQVQGAGSGRLPALNTGQTCLGVVGQLLGLPAVPLLSCVGSTALAGFFTITGSFSRALSQGA